MAKAKKAKNEKTAQGRSEKPITTEVSEASRDRSVGSQPGSRPAPAHQRKGDVTKGKVPWNEEYAVLKEFAALENTPNVPCLDLPGLDIVSAAKGFGCAGVLTRTKEEIKEAFGAALSAEGPTVIVIPIAHEDRPLVPPVSD